MSRLVLLLLLAGVGAVWAQDVNEELFAATRKGDVAQVKALLDKGADVNARNRYDSTPLFFACDRGNLEVAKLLIERGAKVDVEDNFYHATPLGWAMNKKHKGILVLLLEHGANPEAPLIAAITTNNKEDLDLVLEKGKPSAQLLSEMLYLAEQSKREPMVEALKAKGAKPVAASLSDEQLAKYAGKYQEEGSDASVNISVKDGALQFTNQGLNVKMLALGDHKFKYIQYGLLVTFVPGADGEIVGARVPGRGGESMYKRVKEAK